MENFVEILNTINMPQLVAIAIIVWFFYDRLDKKINKLDAKIDKVKDEWDTKIDKVRDELDTKINNLYNLLFTCLNVSAVKNPEPKKRKRS